MVAGGVVVFPFILTGLLLPFLIGNFRGNRHGLLSASALLFRASQGRQQLVSEALNREIKDPAQIDSFQTRRCDFTDEFRRYLFTPTIPVIKGALHLRRVPGHGNVGEQAQGIGHCLHFVLSLRLVSRDSARVDRAL